VFRVSPLISLRPRIALLGLAIVLILLATASTAAAATKQSTKRPVPQGFVGMMVDGPVYPDTDNHVNLARQLDVMVSTGVQTLRAVFDWEKAQPYVGWSDVPASQAKSFVDVAGIPTRFGPLDQLVGLAAGRGLSILPVVINSPRWDADTNNPAVEANPRSVYWYAQFAKALVERYGPKGTFWAHRSAKVPIRMWQIWNEPNIPAFWPVQPFAQSYVYMLSAAREAIKGADPTAKIVLAGMPNYSWVDLGKIYRIAGARSLFDVVAIHPYTKTPQGVITILSYARRVMNANGDRAKPMLADEVSWPSSAGKTKHNLGFDFATSEAQEARNVGQVLPLLAKNRKRLNLAGFYYYTWAATERRNALPFEFAGLFRYTANRFIAKPVFDVFRRSALALEHCRAKRLRATSCA
jgi:hypothetical protein